MTRTIEIGAVGMGPEAARVSLEDVFRYGEMIAHAVATYKSIEGMAVGSSMNLEPFKLKVGSEEFDIDPGIIKRVK